MEENAVNLELIKKMDHRWLSFEFIHHLDEQNAKDAIVRWNEYMMEVKSGKLDLIFDCRKMKNYDTNARLLWQKNMVDKKQQIGDIWIISQNRLILAAAKTMGLLTGFKIKTTTQLEEVFLSKVVPII